MRSLLVTLILLPAGTLLALESLRPPAQQTAAAWPLPPISTLASACSAREPVIPAMEAVRPFPQEGRPAIPEVAAAPPDPSAPTAAQRSLEAERLLRKRAQRVRTGDSGEPAATLEGIDQRLRDLRAEGDLAWSLPALGAADDEATFARSYSRASDEDLAVERWMLETHWLAEREQRIAERLSGGRYVDVGAPGAAPG